MTATLFDGLFQNDTFARVRALFCLLGVLFRRTRETGAPPCWRRQIGRIVFKSTEGTMVDKVADHYAGGSNIVGAITESLGKAGKDIGRLTTADLGTVDEFHIRGRPATLELAHALNLGPGSHVLDIGSGLGGPARTLAETYGCRVTGIDLTPAFCDAATTLTEWVGLGELASFRQGDATHLPFTDGTFDAAMSIHVSMNIARKDQVYAEARRVLKPGGRLAIYEILQGEGGDVLFPVPWAREPSISHLATPDEMKALLTGAGFEVVEVMDSTEEGQRWFEAMAARLATGAVPAVTFQAFLGNDFPEMARNQVMNLRDRRIRTITYVCQA